MELYVLLTIASHVLLAIFVGAHAEISGRSRLRWVPFVLVAGVIGALWYFGSADDGANAGDGDGAADSDTEAAADESTAWNGEATVDDPDAVPDERPDWLDRRSRDKRLHDPNSLHVDLPDGTTLTSEEQAAVGAVIEYIEEEPEADAHDVCEEVFEAAAAEPDGPDLDLDSGFGAAFGAGDDDSGPDRSDADAGYEDADVWWTEIVHPALRGLPEVEPPPRADERELTFDVRTVEELEDRRVLEIDDGRRREEFFAKDGEVWAADGDAVARTTPGWMRLAHGAATEAVASERPTDEKGESGDLETANAATSGDREEADGFASGSGTD